MRESLAGCWRYRWRLGFMLICCAVTSVTASAQALDARIPVCSKEFCQEMVIYATVLDSLVDHTDGCGEKPAAVLRTLHSAPYSWRDARRGGSLLAPQSPVLGRIDDGPDPFRRFGDQVLILDADGFAARNRNDGCRFIFSPVTWMTESYVRVVVLQIFPGDRGLAERYFYLRRAGNRWTVALLEDGMVS